MDPALRTQSTSAARPRRQAGWLTAVKVAAMASSSFLWVALSLRIVTTTSGPMSWSLVAVGLLFGYGSADLLSGTVHWFCDSFFDPETPVIGRLVIFPFRDHHSHPQRIVGYRFFEQDTTSFFLMLTPMMWVWIERQPSGSLPSLFWCSYLAALAAGSFATNALHRWAHAPRVPAAIRWLQRSGVVLSPEHHWRHHDDHSRAFCVTSGWMNRGLDPLSFFPRLERLLRGILPGRRRRSGPRLSRASRADG